MRCLCLATLILWACSSSDTLVDFGPAPQLPPLTMLEIEVATDARGVVQLDLPDAPRVVWELHPDQELPVQFGQDPLVVKSRGANTLAMEAMNLEGDLLRDQPLRFRVFQADEPEGIVPVRIVLTSSIGPKHQDVDGFAKMAERLHELFDEQGLSLSLRWAHLDLHTVGAGSDATWRRIDSAGVLGETTVVLTTLANQVHLGWTPTVPGPIGHHHDGVIFIDLHEHTDIYRRLNNVSSALLAETIAHHIGHYAGLEHVCETCDRDENWMHPEIRCGTHWCTERHRLTSEQRDILWDSLVVR